MALHYHLANVYELTQNNKEQVLEQAQIFVNKAPKQLKKIKKHIDDKNFEKTNKWVIICKPIYELFGMDLAVEELIEIEKWCSKEGRKKEIIEVYNSLKSKTDAAVKEIRKDFKIPTLQTVTQK